MLALRRRMQINPQSAEIMGHDRSGIGAISTGDMVPEDMAGGGIIAFKDKGAVKTPVIDDEALLQEKIAKYGSQIWDKPAFSKSDEMQAAMAAEAKANKDTEFFKFLRDTGVGTMAGTSQFGLSNLGTGASYANTQAGRRAELQDANDKLAMQQQVEAEKAEFARKSGMLNNMQTSLTQLQNKKLGLAQIAASKDAAAATAAASREAALLPKYYQIYSNQLSKNKTSIEKTLKDNFKVYDYTPDQIDAMAVAQTNKQFDPKMLSLIGVVGDVTNQNVAPPTKMTYDQYKLGFSSYKDDPAKQKAFTEYARKQGVVK
jgi:multidrug efflux pump subunit AcrA (membrane-fusion protein)